MIQFNVDPYDLLMQLNMRCKLLEEHVKEIQLNQLQISKMMEQQLQMIKQLQSSEEVLGTTLGMLLNKQS